MTRELKVGQYHRGRRIVQLKHTRSRGWKATDEAGNRYYQRGPQALPDGLHTRTSTGVTLSTWPPSDAAPRKRLSPVSKTNKRWNAPGRARPDEPMAERCEAAIEGVCSGEAPTDRHHIIPRGPGSSDEAWNTRDLCRGCHRAVHARPYWAKSVGFLRSRPVPGACLLASVALVAAVCAGLLALGGCAEGDAGRVCQLPNAADCESHTGGEAGP